MVKRASDKVMMRVQSRCMYKELMKQDWVTRHVSLGNLMYNDPAMYCMMLHECLSPAEALQGRATGRRSYRIRTIIPLRYGSLRQMTLCMLVHKNCRCQKHN